MPSCRRSLIPALSLIIVAALAAAAAGCTSSGPAFRGSSAATSGTVRPSSGIVRPSRGTPSIGASTGSPAGPATGPTAAPSTGHRPPGSFTIAFAGDVHFAGRIGDGLARNPATVFGPAAPGLAKADLTMVNLETAITTGGKQQGKEFTFRAPPEAFVALRDAGIDVATMANNHGADYGESGLRDSLAAISRYHFPVVGIGKNAAQAYAPYTTTLNGVRVAIIAADQVQDETTLRLFSAGRSTPGIANAYSPRLLAAVRAAKAKGYLVIVYVHWGVEYQTCPSPDQETLASSLARAGAAAVIGAHAHVVQGAGWLANGTYVEYGLGNYLWWRSFGNVQDDNGVLTLTVAHRQVVQESFAPAHLDDRGVPLPATGSEYTRIHHEWAADRTCADLSAHVPN